VCQLRCPAGVRPSSVHVVGKNTKLPNQEKGSVSLMRKWLAVVASLDLHGKGQPGLENEVHG